MNIDREIRVTHAMLSISAVASGIGFAEITLIALEYAWSADWLGVAGQVLFAAVVAILIHGYFVYFFTRLGHLRRLQHHLPAQPAELDDVYDNENARLVVLVPSYAEEPAVVRRTLLSAALQRYPIRQIVLLIDDPPEPRDRAGADRLREMRQLAPALGAEFAALAEYFDAAFKDFLGRCEMEAFDGPREAARLAGHHRVAEEWLQARIDSYQVCNHADAVFRDEVIRKCRDEHSGLLRRYDELARKAGTDRDSARREYRRLATLFRVEFSSFERKRYVNLSHEPNKAMNLNSYIGLMGKSFCAEQDPAGHGLVLRETPADRAEMHFPDTDLLVTLDADSILLPDYAMRLARVMNAPGNDRVAVVQTPYSAFPGAPGMLERIAGATTDIQYLIHQGFTHYHATFWVGANALLRKTALLEIRQEFVERGYQLYKYIQDRTVIEDTESTIDLVDRGWSLVNYPSRLSYSATPPDFGSLLIQRRRWANGGLIILPKALRYLRRGRPHPYRLTEAFLRVHYLTSIALINVAVLVILFGGFERNMRIAWLGVAGLPYVFVFARDLVYCGYRTGDFLRVYALNLLLVPVHLSGAFKSLHQAITGRKTPFGRTPKVPGRTAAPAGYVFAEFSLLVAAAFLAGSKLARGAWLSGAFSLGFFCLLCYAIVRFVGLRDGVVDMLRRVLTTRDSSAPTDPEPS